MNNKQKIDKTIHILCKPGVNTTDMVSGMSEMGEVWYHS